jgi:3-dehydroquinate dehydratase-1
MCFAASQKTGLVAISMGENGTISRIAAPLFGSLFTYCFVDGSVAPGQLGVKETAAMLDRLYPGRNNEIQVNTV